MHSLAQSRRLFLLGLSLTLLGDASLGYAFSSQSASPQAENAPLCAHLVCGGDMV